MPNLFERPIAANPMSTFEALPLEYIDRAIQRKQDYYDKAKAEIDAQDDSLLKLQYLSGDSERHHELQKGLEDRLNTIVDSADGDYSNVLPQLDRFSRDLKYETTQGELGQQQNNFLAAMKMKEDQDDRLADGKTSEEGYNIFMQSIGKHKTQRLDDGTYSRFQGYTPSNITNPLDPMHNSAKEIVKKWNDEGMGYRAKPEIIQNLSTLIATNGNLRKSLMEKYQASGAEMSFGEYVAAISNQVAENNSYEEQAKITGAGGKSTTTTLPTVYNNIPLPEYVKGDFSYASGSSAFFKNLGESVGLDTWKETKDWVNSEEGKRTISFMESKATSPFPESPGEQRDWLLENYNKPLNSRVVTRGATPIEQKAIVDGVITNPTTAIRSMETGKLLSGAEVKALSAPAKSGDGATRKSLVTGIVSGGDYPPGSLVFVGNDGASYIQEPNNPEVLRSYEYNNSLIELAGRSRTGEKTVTLEAPITSSAGSIPKGTYTVKYNPKTGAYDMYSPGPNGKLLYKKTTGADGKPKFFKKNYNE